MLKGAIFGISAAAIWGGMYVISDVVLEVIPPLTLLTIRVVMGLVVLLAMMRMQKLSFPPRPVFMRVLGVGVVGFGFSLAAQFIGTALSTAVNGALVTSASPAFILLFAALILREKLTPMHLLAVGLATLGVIVIVNPAEADFGSDTFVGNLFLAIAALTWGLYSVLVRRVSLTPPQTPPRTQGGASDSPSLLAERGPGGEVNSAILTPNPSPPSGEGNAEGLNTLVLTTIAFMGGLCLTVPAMAIELTQENIGIIDVGIVAGILYLGVISTAGAMWLWNRAFALVDASIASLFFFAQPLTGALLGALFLDQPMTTGLWIGIGLIVGGVLLSLRKS
ncbi:MAG: membrane protein [Chloroflexota bacterium]|nr:MAG: membrane protein [Chloroflexota bacterium]